MSQGSMAGIIDREMTKVVAAAVMWNGTVYSKPPPARHHHILHERMATLIGSRSHIPKNTQGFLLSDGTFATRKEAAEVAIRAGQINSIQHPGHGLFSEELW